MIGIVEVSEVLKTFIAAIDIVNPILKKHHRRVAIMAYHIGRKMKLSRQQLARLVVAALLHDIGALTVEDATQLAKLDVHNPEPHAILGAGMLKSYPPFEQIRRIIRYHHIKYTDIHLVDNVPIESLIIHLADRIEILLDRDQLALSQTDRIVDKVMELRGRTFAPKVVDMFIKIASKEYIWLDLDHLTVNELFEWIDISWIHQGVSASIEGVLYTLSRIIDYKSSFTSTHSIGVAHMAYRIAKLYGMDEEKSYDLKLAGYLHDLGKIGVPSEIIAKPLELNKEEFDYIKLHPYFTYEILRHIKGLEQIAIWASSHHENRQSSGYPRKLELNHMDIEMQIISYADVFTALCEERPYREGMSLDSVMDKLRTDFKEKLGDEIFSLMQEHVQTLFDELNEVRRNARNEYDTIFIA